MAHVPGRSRGLACQSARTDRSRQCRDAGSGVALRRRRRPARRHFADAVQPARREGRALRGVPGAPVVRARRRDRRGVVELHAGGPGERRVAESRRGLLGGRRRRAHRLRRRSLSLRGRRAQRSPDRDLRRRRPGGPAAGPRSRRFRRLHGRDRHDTRQRLRGSADRGRSRERTRRRGTGARARRSTSAPASSAGSSTRSRSPASSAPTPGRPTPGRKRAARMRGRVSAWMRSAGWCSCRPARRRRTSRAPRAEATISSPIR